MALTTSTVFVSDIICEQSEYFRSYFKSLTKKLTKEMICFFLLSMLVGPIQMFLDNKNHSRAPCQFNRDCRKQFFCRHISDGYCVCLFGQCQTKSRRWKRGPFSIDECKDFSDCGCRSLIFSQPSPNSYSGLRLDMLFFKTQRNSTQLKATLSN